MSKKYRLHVDFGDIGYNHFGSLLYVLVKAYTYRNDYADFTMTIKQQTTTNRNGE